MPQALPLAAAHSRKNAHALRLSGWIHSNPNSSLRSYAHSSGSFRCKLTSRRLAASFSRLSLRIRYNQRRPFASIASGFADQRAPQVIEGFVHEFADMKAVDGQHGAGRVGTDADGMGAAHVHRDDPQRPSV